ncbi:hypothetical protein Y032_0040g331 [Ancylostoma ceylanicum]|nr:hypothetical protein Y032_0040g331 [Ancylostoma ceylanicum]
MHCVMVEHSGPILNSNQETVNCIHGGFFWDLQAMIPSIPLNDSKWVSLPSTGTLLIRASYSKVVLHHDATLLWSQNEVFQ